jgi:hypothetical protein
MSKENAKLRREALSYKSHDLPEPDVIGDELYKANVRACIKLIRNIPTRQEYLGGQMFKYVQVGEVVDSIRLHFGVDNEH